MRVLAVNPRRIDRLLDLYNASTVGRIEAALAACGKVARVELADLVGV